MHRPRDLTVLLRSHRRRRVLWWRSRRRSSRCWRPCAQPRCRRPSATGVMRLSRPTWQRSARTSCRPSEASSISRVCQSLLRYAPRQVPRHGAWCLGMVCVGHGEAMWGAGSPGSGCLSSVSAGSFVLCPSNIVQLEHAWIVPLTDVAKRGYTVTSSVVISKRSGPQLPITCRRGARRAAHF